MKVTTEKLPKSLLAIDVELDRDQVEKGLDRAARKIGQQITIPGFRKGKAPRFIVENYYGRAALLEEASDDLINRTFRDVLEQQKISPVGPAALDSANFREEPYGFRVLVPIDPTIALPDYRTVRKEITVTPVTDEMLTAALDDRRERHVVLKPLEEPRPAQQGDQLTATVESFVDGESVEGYTEGQEIPESKLIMEPTRLAAGLFEPLLGVEVGQTREITVHMPDDHANEKVQGKDVVFKITVSAIEERLLPDWDELPTLEESEGTIDELRTKTRTELEEAARETAERDAINSYVEEIVQQTSFDIPDAMIAHQAEHLLEEQGEQFKRYGISLDQMLQYRGTTREAEQEKLLPEAEERLKTSLAMQEIIKAEGLVISPDEISDEIDRTVASYEPDQQELARNMLSTQLVNNVATNVLNRKLRDRLLAIATGAAPELTSAEEPAEAPTEA